MFMFFYIKYNGCSVNDTYDLTMDADTTAELENS